MTDNLWAASAADLAHGFGSDGPTPVDALDSVLGRLDAVNGELNAVVTIDREGARAAAEASRARWAKGQSLGPLDGVPLTIKDNIPTAGLRSTWGSRLYAEWVPEIDETPVKRLREAGVVILGKTNVPEMTLQGYTSNPLFGVTRNPWNTKLSPGGSTGGGVAAVAAGIGPLALATDGGGSIRRPACHAGLVGLKPTIDRVPRRDGFPQILLDFEVIGLVARNVADLATGMAAISAADPASVPVSGFGPIAPGRSVAPRRILYVPTFAGAPIDPEVAESVAEAARHLSALGHHVEASRDFTLADEVNAAWPLIAQAGLAWLAGSEEARAMLGPDIRAMAESGLEVSGPAYFDALRKALVLRQELATFFRGTDLILTPTAAALPWPAETAYPPEIAGQAVGPRGSAIFTGFVNAAGLPAISVPCRPSREGLPIGFQLIAPWGGDEDLLALAAAYEAAHPWAMSWEAQP